MKHCPFKPSPDRTKKLYSRHSPEDWCHPDCALWVKKAEMCSFRLLADSIVDHRERRGDYKPRKEKPQKTLDCGRCGSKESVTIIPNPLNPMMMKDKLHCFACGRTWPMPKEKP